MSGWRTVRRCNAWLTLVCLMSGGRLMAQESPEQPTHRSGNWGLVDAIGYGGVGAFVGYASAIGASFSNSSDSDIGIMLIAGPVAGLALGAMIGHNASSRINRGESLSGASRFAVGTGAILAGATLGALASMPLINGDGAGTPLGSDETTFAVLTTTGVVLSALYMRRHADDFRSRRVSIAPVRTTDRAYGLRVALRY